MRLMDQLIFTIFLAEDIVVGVAGFRTRTPLTIPKATNMDIKFNILTIAIAFLITTIPLLTISLAFAMGYLATIYILAVLNPCLFKHRKRGITDLNDASPKHNPNNRGANRLTYFWHRIRNSSLFKSIQHLGLSNIYFSRSARGISYPLALCSKLINPANFSERSKPAPMLNACLPQKTPSASPGQARCLSNTVISHVEPSPKARQAFPLTQKLSLDHDHATGRPRALLHQQCNLKVAQIEASTPYPRLTLTELALQFRKKHYQLLCAALNYTEGSLALRCLSWL